MRTSAYLTALLMIFLIISGCESRINNEMTESLIREAQHKFAPDRRTVVFDVQSVVSGNRLTLTGEIHSNYLKNRLLEYLRERVSYGITDSIAVLPQLSLGKKTFGVVNVSVANIRTKPDHGEELATQAILGTPLKILKHENGWYYVQTPDEYLGWIDGQIEIFTKEEYEVWAAGPKIIVTVEYGFTYASEYKESGVVSDVVIGSLLKLKNEDREHYHVEYPDGRTAFLPKQHGQPFAKWLAGAKDTPETVLSTAKRFMGVPYLWGGTSAKGMDCSGYTKTVYFLNGVLLPRDASQQVLVGDPVGPGRDLENLKMGDLVFFGSRAMEKKPERVTHVGIYLGDKRFIHASGDVHINSFDPAAADYSEYRSRTFLRAQRIIGAGETAGVRRLAQISYYRGSEPYLFSTVEQH